MKKTIVTTSWDDGHILDIKLSTLLSRYGIPATFYIAPANREIPPANRLSAVQVKELSEQFEIGAHTMTHPRLSDVDAKTAQAEIVESKSALENQTGKAVTSFCYPGGDFSAEHKQMVKDAGFTTARTVKRFSFASDHADDFEMPTTVQAYRHWSDLFPIIKNSHAENVLTNYLNWDDLAIALFEKAHKESGTFHLWGHSWEVEKNNDWKRLERVFSHIGGRTDVQYATNNQLT